MIKKFRRLSDFGAIFSLPYIQRLGVLKHLARQPFVVISVISYPSHQVPSSVTTAPGRFPIREESRVIWNEALEETRVETREGLGVVG